jgi:hypothetical protein
MPDEIDSVTRRVRTAMVDGIEIRTSEYVKPGEHIDASAVPTLAFPMPRFAPLEPEMPRVSFGRLRYWFMKPDRRRFAFLGVDLAAPAYRPDFRAMRRQRKLARRLRIKAENARRAKRRGGRR